MSYENPVSNGWVVFWIILAILVIAVAIGVPCGYAANTEVAPMDKYTLVYEGGPLDGRDFIKQVEPGVGRFWKGNLQSTYMYPSTQRTYIIASEEYVGDVPIVDVLEVNCKGANKAYLETSMTFTVVKENLQEFHERLGLKYKAWEEDGWDYMLEEQVRQPLEAAFQEEAKKYTNIEACNEIGMIQMADAVAVVIQNRIDAHMGGHYIKIGVLQVTNAKPDGTVQLEIEKIAAAQQAVQSAEYRKQAAEIDAKANVMLRESLQGEGGMTAVLQKAVESGRITFWVLPSDMEIVGPTAP